MTTDQLKRSVKTFIISCRMPYLLLCGDSIVIFLKCDECGAEHEFLDYPDKSLVDCEKCNGLLTLRGEFNLFPRPEKQALLKELIESEKWKKGVDLTRARHVKDDEVRINET